MILTVTLNAALDVTYRVPRISRHTCRRVSAVSHVAGGKSVNVASVLALQGVPVLATGLLGGVAGGLIRSDLDARGIRHDFPLAAGPDLVKPNLEELRCRGRAGGRTGRRRAADATVGESLRRRSSGRQRRCSTPWPGRRGRRTSTAFARWSGSSSRTRLTVPEATGRTPGGRPC